MTTSDELGEFPAAGDEAANLLGALNRIRGTFAWKCGGLDAAALRTPLGPSTITLGGLLRHLTFVEQIKFTSTLGGADPGAPWNEGHDEPDWEWSTAAAHSPEELMADLAHRGRELATAGFRGGGRRAGRPHRRLSGPGRPSRPGAGDGSGWVRRGRPLHSGRHNGSCERARHGPRGRSA